MPAYVLIRETRKERRAPLRLCLSVAAGLGLGGALLGATAYVPALAAGLFRFIPLPVPISEPGRATEDHVIRIKADSNGHYYVKGSADGVPLEFMIDTGASYITLTKEAAGRLSVGPLNFNLATTTANGPIQNAQITIRQLTVGLVHHQRHSRCGERRRTRSAIAGHELAPPLPINRNPKQRDDAPLLRNVTWSM